MEGVEAAMTTRNLEPDRWRNREEWNLVSGRQPQMLKKLDRYIKNAEYHTSSYSMTSKSILMTSSKFHLHMKLTLTEGCWMQCCTRPITVI
jgi:hypothetical protein